MTIRVVSTCFSQTNLRLDWTQELESDEYRGLNGTYRTYDHSGGFQVKIDAIFRVVEDVAWEGRAFFVDSQTEFRTFESTDVTYKLSSIFYATATARRHPFSARILVLHYE